MEDPADPYDYHVKRLVCLGSGMWDLRSGIRDLRSGIAGSQTGIPFHMIVIRMWRILGDEGSSRSL